MKSIPAMPLTSAVAADHLHRPLLVMKHPRHRQDPSGDGNDAKTEEHHHRNQSSPSSVWGTTSPYPTVVMVTIAQ